MKKTCCGSVIRNKTLLKVVEPKGRKWSESLSCGFNHEILPWAFFPNCFVAFKETINSVLRDIPVNSNSLP